MTIMMTRHILLIIVGLFLQLQVQPAGAADAHFPERITFEKQQMTRVGAATLEVLWFDVYHAGLWAPGGYYTPGRIHALELLYMRDFDEESLVEESIEQMEKLGDFSDDRLAYWRGLLERLGLSVREGDRVRMVTLPGQSVVFIKNGREIGEVNDPGFASYFSQIWLDPSSDYPDFTRELKGVAPR